MVSRDEKRTKGRTHSSARGSGTMKDQELESSLQVSDAGQPTAGEPALDLIEPLEDEASSCPTTVISYRQNGSEATANRGQGWVTGHAAEGARAGKAAPGQPGSAMLDAIGLSCRCWRQLSTSFPERPGFPSGTSENGPPGAVGGRH